MSLNIVKRIVAAGVLALGVALGSTHLARADGESLIGKPIPPFRAITAWINSPPLTAQKLHGKVTLIEFWTFDCINCKHTLPYLVGWDKHYRSQGLQTIGIHTPELAYERDVDNVRHAVKEDDIAYPVAFDPTYATWQAYGNNVWPHIYLADKKGIIRFESIGEGGYDKIEAKIRELLAER